MMLRIIKKYVNKPSFVLQKIFNRNFAAIHKIEPVLALDKAIFVGFSILDLSKLLMYEFHQKYINANRVVMLICFFVVYRHRQLSL